MRNAFLILASLAASAVGPTHGDRPDQKRENADYVFSGSVKAVYVRDTKGYRQYVVEVRIDEVKKGKGLKKGDTFRAFCYQRKKGAGGLEFDTAGHKAVPKEGQRIRAFVNAGRGHNEGVYPDWFDVLRAGKK